MNGTTKEKYQIELRRLEQEIAALDRHWQNVPRYFWFALLAPVVWAYYGFAAAMVELMVTLSLVGVRAYLIGVRQSENRWTHDSLVRELQS